jgi:predicted phosphoribosyltransferase
VDSKIIDEPAYRNRIFIFKDRLHAGELLAHKLKNYVKNENAQALAIPAGGVPVGFMASKILKIPFDIIIVRKIQIPWNPEAGIGAVTWNGTVILNEPLITQLGLSADDVKGCISRTREAVSERFRLFRGEKPPPNLKDKTAVLIDDGLASGFTMLAAVKSVEKQKPSKIIIAIPTASASAVELLTASVDMLICLNIRGGPVFAVADAYREWYDLSDQEVLEFLKK